MRDELHPAVADLLELARQRGWLSYEELNNTLPDEMVDPVRIDRLLVLVDRTQVELIDEMEFRARLFRAKRDGLDQVWTATTLARQFRAMSVAGGGRGGETEAVRAKINAEHHGPAPDPSISQAERDVAEAAALDDEAVRRDIDDAIAGEESTGRRIDDPVRMYLTQMGSIPLLTRDEEIRLAKKIEVTRMIFRRRCLESDYVIARAIETLKQVDAGELPFDRTMRISTAEENHKEKIAARIPANLGTIEPPGRAQPRGLGGGRAPARVARHGDQDQGAAGADRLPPRRMATLTEELCLRTGRIVPLMASSSRSRRR
ncbi:MAG: sigma-70 factor domain-containing protein [Phycisphaerales bacterium]